VYVKIIEGGPTLFCCIQPEDIILRIRTDFILSLNEIVSELIALSPANNDLCQEAFQKIKVGLLNVEL
jgi:HTH-type transcriptional regulator, sugar sensing transcriptional regulator